MLVRKLAAIMFTDIVGFTSLIGMDEDWAVFDLYSKHILLIFALYSNQYYGRIDFISEQFAVTNQ